MQPESQLLGYEGVDWKRLQGYEIPRDGKEKDAFIWLHGWRLWNNKKKEYWLCRLCYIGPPRRATPKGYILASRLATTSAIRYLRQTHRLNNKSEVVIGTESERENTIDGYCAASAVRNKHAAEFKANTFKALFLTAFIEESIAFRKAETPSIRAFIEYLQPLAKGAIPSHQTLVRWMHRAYNRQLGVVIETLQSALSRINLSFDFWTSPNNQLALLGLVAHFIDSIGTPKTMLLSLPYYKGAYTGRLIANTISDIIAHYSLSTKLGYFITDNASNNDTCLQFLAKEYGFVAAERHVRYAGHVLNLVAKAILFGSDVQAFEHSLEDVELEEQELLLWRKKGATRKLHNLVKFITALP